MMSNIVWSDEAWLLFRKSKFKSRSLGSIPKSSLEKGGIGNRTCKVQWELGKGRKVQHILRHTTKILMRITIYNIQYVIYNM